MLRQTFFRNVHFFYDFLTFNEVFFFGSQNVFILSYPVIGDEGFVLDGEAPAKPSPPCIIRSAQLAPLRFFLSSLRETPCAGRTPLPLHRLTNSAFNGTRSASMPPLPMLLFVCLLPNVGAVNHPATIQPFHKAPMCLVGAGTPLAAAPLFSPHSPRQ